MVIEIRSSPLELRARIGCVAVLASLFFLGAVGLARAFLGSSLAPALVALALAGLFLWMRLRRITARRALILDRAAGRIGFEVDGVPPGRLPAPAPFSSARAVTLHAPEGRTFHREVRLEADHRTIVCFALHGRRVPLRKAQRADEGLREIVRRMRAYLGLSPGGI
ncbi:MAG: hypothetical protein HY720_28105 [Planctomycetes bacterium]|nr:hypothetical protein [Planctomycetota bacterium]